MCFINTDVADLVGAQRDAVEKSTLLQKFLDAIPVHIAERGVEVRFLFANRYLFDRLGTSGDAVFNKTAMDFFPNAVARLSTSLASR